MRGNVQDQIVGKGGVFGSLEYAIVSYLVRVFSDCEEGRVYSGEGVFRDRIIARGWWCYSFMVWYFPI